MKLHAPLLSLRALAGVQILAACTLLPLASAAAAPASELAASRQRIEASDFRVSGRLVSVSPTGARVSHKVRIKGHWFPDGLLLLFEITNPAPERMRLLVHMSPAGVLTLQSGKPGMPAVKLAADHLHDPLAGTAFTVEDLTDAQFFWWEQSTLTQQAFASRQCAVLKSLPAAENHSAYSEVQSWVAWLDPSTAYPIHVVKTLRGGQQRTFTSFGLRQTSGVWSPTQIEVQAQGQPGSSLLLFDRGSPKAHLTRRDFDLGQAFAPDEAQ